MKNSKITKITFCGLMTALTVVMSQISVPMPFGVPVTLQTFAICLSGYFLGLKFGLASILCYVVLGVIGMPVFSGFKGGLSVLFGVTGGYITGFIFLAVLCGCSEFFAFRKYGKTVSVLLGIAGLAVCHMCGIIQFSALTGSGIVNAFLTATLPFIPKDIVSCLIAYALSARLSAIVSRHGVLKKTK